MFPTIEAAPPGPNVDDWNPGDTVQQEDAAPAKQRGVLRKRRDQAVSRDSVVRGPVVAGWIEDTREERDF